MYPIALFFLQWLHVVFAILWFGSVLFTNIVLFPGLKTLAPRDEAAVLALLRTGRGYRTALVMSIGTVSLGILRGVVGGVLQSLDTAYGVTYLAALVIGLAMVGWLLFNPFRLRLQSMQPSPEADLLARRQQLFSNVYLAGFPVIFTLMIAMRFGY
jgi:uncharacterized membrane protein